MTKDFAIFKMERFETAQAHMKEYRFKLLIQQKSLQIRMSFNSSLIKYDNFGVQISYRI